MEKYIPANGDFPPTSKESGFFSIDVLVKTKTNIWFVGWCYYPDDTWTHTNDKDFWVSDDIDGWWYLPE